MIHEATGHSGWRRRPTFVAFQWFSHTCILNPVEALMLDMASYPTIKKQLEFVTLTLFSVPVHPAYKPKLPATPSYHKVCT
jgi:hypothetical protein